MNGLTPALFGHLPQDTGAGRGDIGHAKQGQDVAGPQDAVHNRLIRQAAAQAEVMAQKGWQGLLRPHGDQG